MRTMQVIGSPGLGGAEQAFLRLLPALRQAGLPTAAVVRRGSRLADLLAGAADQQVLPLRGMLDLRSALLLRNLARERGIEVLQSWMTRATWLARVPRGCLHVARLGGYYRPRYFRHAHAWITNTRGLREWLLKLGFPPGRVCWIHNFLDDEAPRAPALSRAGLGIPEDALLIAAMGRLREKKGFSDLIAAFGRLPHRVGSRPVHLLLMGYGEQLAALEALARPWSERIHFSGWIDHAVKELALADVFVCPSREEPFGNVLMEAWSQALPVVSTRTAGGCEMIEDGVDGLLTPVGDAAALATALLRLLHSEALREDLAGNGMRALSSRFSRGAAIARYQQFYQDMRRHLD